MDEHVGAGGRRRASVRRQAHDGRKAGGSVGESAEESYVTYGVATWLNQQDWLHDSLVIHGVSQIGV